MKIKKSVPCNFEYFGKSCTISQKVAFQTACQIVFVTKSAINMIKHIKASNKNARLH